MVISLRGREIGIRDIFSTSRSDMISSSKPALPLVYVSRNAYHMHLLASHTIYASCLAGSKIYLHLMHERALAA